MNLSKTKITQHLLFFTLAFGFVFSGYSQTPSTTTSQILKSKMYEPDKNGIYSVIEKMPQYPGGESALLSYISKNLKYPISAQEKGIQGRIIIRFVVTKTGKVGKVEILRGLDPEMDKEGLRVVSSLADWFPGEQKGEKVDVYYTLPITFKLQRSANSPGTAQRNKPIFVLDGVKLAKDFNMNKIKKEDIESIKLIKPDTDAKRTELIDKYGKEAANGIMMITTKK